MAGKQSRYRGAHPFSDDPLSQRTFFGRERAALLLTNQILANRLVVLYAKSGVGKSSLLNAGVAPRLLEAGCQPLVVRVNDLGRGPVEAIFEGVRAQAQHHGVEYVHGDTSSLWAFFKTVEFWRGDLLLTPVLVIDQFEELFTLVGDEARDRFLEEFARLLRTGRSPGEGAADQLSDAPPAMHIVLSLREDFLGILEDAADRIPQILDHRFRLAPLTREEAREAIVGPASLEDPAFATPPIVFAPGFVDAVLDHLSMRAGPAVSAARRSVEPFHLQLTCQRIEQIARERGGQRAGVALDMRAFGGEAALSATLGTFYRDAIASVERSGQREAARRLCREFLISPEGRRLSLEEYELRRQVGLSQRSLHQLVERRLLRTDRRSDSTYYELSHDALVEPILATRRMQGVVVSGLSLVLSALALAFGVLLGLAALAKLGESTDQPLPPGETVEGWVFLLLLGGVMGYAAWKFLKRSWVSLRRFRRRPVQVAADALPEYVSWFDRWSGHALKAFGGFLVGVSVLVVVFSLVALAVLTWTAGQPPGWMNDFNEDGSLLDLYRHPWRELGWLAVQALALAWFGHWQWRAGHARLHPEARRAEAPSALEHWGQAAGLSPAAVRLASAIGPLAAVLVALAVFTVAWTAFSHCTGAATSPLPGWMPAEFSYPEGTCAELSRRAWLDTWDFFLTIVAGAWLLGRTVLQAVRARRGQARYRPAGAAVAAGKRAT